MTEYFITFIYQPFFNLLVFFYWLLDFVTRGNGDMGIAVILLTIVIRVILYPLSLAEQKSHKERQEITEQIKQIEEQYRTDHIAQVQAKKSVMKTNRRVLIAEIINLIIQVTVALMLWKIFATGLKGEDFHLLYSFMPKIDEPFNLVFLGKYDLTKPSLTLNLIQSVLIFVLETILLLGSDSPVTKQQFVRLQIILPIASFIIFLGLPAGKKVFIISTLVISIILSSIRTIQYRFESYKAKKEEEELKAAEEQVIVEVK
jgi:YidC/Oxa1 family membrane protein insertase